MKVLTPGHKYELSNLENHAATGQVLQFIQKEPIAEGSKQFKTVADGTTNEEVLEMLIDRIVTMNAQFSCQENEFCIEHLRCAMIYLKKRTLDRIVRNVEGKAAQ